MCMRLLLPALLLPVACAPAATDDGGDGDGDLDPCPVGSFVASSIAFEESGCLDEVSREGTTFTATAATLSWQVFAFDDTAGAGTVLDDTNSSTTARYEREGLEWVAFTGAIGGQPQGESTLTLDGASDSTWRGQIDGVTVPGGDNESLDSVFITIVVGDDNG